MRTCSEFSQRFGTTYQKHMIIRHIHSNLPKKKDTYIQLGCVSSLIIKQKASLSSTYGRVVRFGKGQTIAYDVKHLASEIDPNA